MGAEDGAQGWRSPAPQALQRGSLCLSGLEGYHRGTGAEFFHRELGVVLSVQDLAHTQYLLPSPFPSAATTVPGEEKGTV